MKSYPFNEKSHYAVNDFRDFRRLFEKHWAFEIAVDQEDNGWQCVDQALILRPNSQRPSRLMARISLQHPQTWTYEVYHRTHIITYTLNVAKTIP